MKNQQTCADCGRVGVRSFTMINGRTVCVSGVACNNRQPTRLTRVPAEPIRALPKPKPKRYETNKAYMRRMGY